MDGPHAVVFVCKCHALRGQTEIAVSPPLTLAASYPETIVLLMNVARFCMSQSALRSPQLGLIVSSRFYRSGIISPCGAPTLTCLL